jgi:hypothetical protein
MMTWVVKMLNWQLQISKDKSFMPLTIFLSFLWRFEPKKVHKIFYFMLDPQHKTCTLCLQA